MDSLNVCLSVCVLVSTLKLQNAKSSLLWAAMQRWSVVTDGAVSRAAWPRERRQLSFPETSLIYYQSTLRSIPEERRYLSHCGRKYEMTPQNVFASLQILKCSEACVWLNWSVVFCTLQTFLDGGGGEGGKVQWKAYFSKCFHYVVWFWCLHLLRRFLYRLPRSLLLRGGTSIGICRHVDI
jgi:hypothetical protein